MVTLTLIRGAEHLRVFLSRIVGYIVDQRRIIRSRCRQSRLYIT